MLEMIEKKFQQKNIKYTFWMAIYMGVLSHGFMMTNKFYGHDDLNCMFSVGGTYRQGRWMLAILGKLVTVLLGGNYSIPFFNGMVSIIFIAISACIIVEVLGIMNYKYALLVGGISTAFPVVACTLGYGFTSYFYFIGLLLTTMAVLISMNTKKIFCFFVASILLCCSLGIYQAYFPIAVVLFVLILFKEVINEKEWKKVLRNALYYLGTLISGLILYLFATKFINAIRGIRMTSYSSMDSMGKITFPELIQAVKNVFKYFYGKNVVIFNLFDGFAGVSFYVLYGIIIGILIFFCIKKKACWQLYVEQVVFCCCLPFAINLICIMSPKTAPYSLMVYPLVFIFIIPLFLLELLDKENDYMFSKLLKPIVCIIISIVIVFYVRMDNKFFLKAELLKEQTQSYYVSLVTQIKELDGYSDDLPVAFLNMENYDDNTRTHIRQLMGIEMRPFHRNEEITQGNMSLFIAYFCGFEPEWIEGEEAELLLQDPDIANMPSYPDDGAIKIVDDVIIVKF